MPLTVSTDLTAADWLRDTDTDAEWWRLVTTGPSGYAAYARLLFLPDPAFEGQSENDATRPDDERSEQQLLALAAESLVAHTGTPDDCWFLWWDGWGIDLGGPKLALPHRQYFLLHGSIADLHGWTQDRLWRHPSDAHPPAFAWPANRRWCITRDVDPHYACIGGPAPAIAALLADPRLEVVATDPSDPQPAYR